jgi:hypothetical protein
MDQIEFRNYHDRVAARLRSLAATATTAALKTQLTEKAEKHKQLRETRRRSRGASTGLPILGNTTFTKLPSHYQRLLKWVRRLQQFTHRVLPVHQRVTRTDSFSREAQARSAEWENEVIR